jgi:hypothetical protein
MRIKHIYLPKWQRWFLLPLFVGMWIFITYMEFYSPQSGEMGTIGYAVFSLFFLGMAIMFWFMTSGTLPAYIIKETDDQGDVQP